MTKTVFMFEVISVMAKAFDLTPDQLLSSKEIDRIKEIAYKRGQYKGFTAWQIEGAISRAKKKVTYQIRAANGCTPDNSNIFAVTTDEHEAKQRLYEAQMQFDYVDVLINGSRYRTI